jgi:hypothetical protein
MDCPGCGRAQPRASARWCGACGEALAGDGSRHPGRQRGRLPGWLRPRRVAVVAGLLVVAVAGLAGWDLLTGPDGVSQLRSSQDVDLPDTVGPPDIPVPEATSADPSPPHHEILWEVDLEAPASQVAIVDAADVVVAVSDATLTGLDVETGEVLWEHDLPEGPVRDLEIAGTQVVAALGPGGVQVVDAATGSLAWQQDRPADGAVIASGVVVVSGDGQVRALPLDTGATRWTLHPAGWVASGRADDVVLVERGSAVAGVATASGATRFVLPGHGELGRADQSNSTAVLVDEGRLRVVGLEDGADLATVEVGLVLDERIRGRPRIAGEESVVVSVGDGLVGFDATLEPRWRTRWDTQVALLGHHDPTLAVLGGIGVRGVEPATGADVFRVTPSAWFTAGHLHEERLALAVHTPTRGRLQLIDLAPAGAGTP